LGAGIVVAKRLVMHPPRPIPRALGVLERAWGGRFKVATFGLLQLLSIAMGDPADLPEQPPIEMSQPAPHVAAGSHGYGAALERLG